MPEPYKFGISVDIRIDTKSYHHLKPDMQWFIVITFLKTSPKNMCMYVKVCVYVYVHTQVLLILKI